jgi:hypothetical protein
MPGLSLTFGILLNVLLTELLAHLLVLLFLINTKPTSLHVISMIHRQTGKSVFIIVIGCSLLLVGVTLDGLRETETPLVVSG